MSRISVNENPFKWKDVTKGNHFYVSQAKKKPKGKLTKKLIKGFFSFGALSVLELKFFGRKNIVPWKMKDFKSAKRFFEAIQKLYNVLGIWCLFSMPPL